MPTTNILARASNYEIKEGLKLLSKKQFPVRRVIGPRNTYLTDTITKTDAMSSATINGPHMAQYIAASIITHCQDGWNFLSRGLDAFLNGDISTTIHLTYYAELRAAMCIMASEGVGVFNRRHVYFNSSNLPITFNDSTHPVANDLLEEWGSLASHKENVFSCVAVNNRTLKDWINSSGHSANAAYASSIVKDWMTNWSIDLRLSQDRKLRNQMSYRPHFEYGEVQIEDAINNLIAIWQGLEPTASNRFVEIDRHLLRLALEQLFRITTGKKISHRRYRPFIENIFGSLGESTTQPLYSFILRDSLPQDHILLSEARRDLNNKNFSLINPFSMICRAILLLKFATTSASLILENTRIRPDLLSFWWEDIALKFGIIDTTPSGITATDLYADVSDSISGLQSGGYSLSSQRAVNMSALGDLCTLKQFQRTCFWGLGL